MKQLISTKQIAITFLILLLASLQLFGVFTPKNVYAQEIVNDPLNTAQNTVATSKSIIQTALSNSLVTKEFVLDNIAWAAVNLLLQEMIRSTTAWVAGGFEGRPAFVENLDGFLLQVADDYALDFINRDIVDFLCSPFQASIEFALVTSYEQTRYYRSSCRVTDAIRNLESFGSGDFIGGGGWDAWFDVSMNRSFYPEAALFEANSALMHGVRNKQKEQVDMLSFGNGFLSKTECEDETDERTCTVTTPGSTIEKYLSDTLNITNERLSIADELNELLATFVTQLAINLFNGSGLAGIGGSNTSANTYFNSFGSQQTPQNYDPYGYVETQSQNAEISDPGVRENIENAENEATQNTFDSFGSSVASGFDVINEIQTTLDACEPANNNAQDEINEVKDGLSASTLALNTLKTTVLQSGVSSTRISELNAIYKDIANLESQAETIECK